MISYFTLLPQIKLTKKSSYGCDNYAITPQGRDCWRHLPKLHELFYVSKIAPKNIDIVRYIADTKHPWAQTL